MKRPPTTGLRHLLFAIGALCTLTAIARAADNWVMRKSITVDTSANGAAITDPIGGAVVLLRLHDGNFQFGAAQPDGSDLRFGAADEKTVLPFHIEKFDSLLNEAFVWVKVPDVKPGAVTSFWLYYGSGGNKLEAAPDPHGLYGSDTALVYHFSGHGLPPTDATGNGNNAANAGLGIDGSLIAGGLTCDGAGLVTIPAAPSLQWAEGAALTWSAWIKLATLADHAILFSRRDGDRAFMVGFDQGVPFASVTNGGTTVRTPAGATLAANAWRHLAVVAADGQLKLYVDGDVYGTVAGRLPALNSAAVIGGDRAIGATDEQAADGTGFSGEIDELEIASAARSSGWIKLAAVNQGPEGGSHLLTYGEDVQPKNWMSWFETGYVGIIISSLSLDGWIVIGLLMVMAVISWMVMTSKASYLKTVRKGNTRFIEAWHQLRSNLAALDDAESDQSKSLGGKVDAPGARVLQRAPLFRIYHLGIEEIRQRVTADSKGGGKSLSARSIQAIRATLDGGLVRETQKLNSLMVLLTIAISGGPFLGLLGTVVGVMITFAAVAAAGDVNVNAIAPGIAAALAATVAGLAVAIPSLFGYNYLVTRIKEATSDMHVFIDEFVTKMAEFYSEPAE